MFNLYILSSHHFWSQCAPPLNILVVNWYRKFALTTKFIEIVIVMLCSGNPLLVSLESSTMAASTRSKKAKLWFSKLAFDGLENEEDEDVELDQMMASNHKEKKTVKTAAVSSDVEESVPAKKSEKQIRKLDPEGLAIGALMVQSKKKREDLIESGYNRWAHNDDNLPDWFMADEAKYCQKTLPITKDMVEVYRSKLKEINSRPIKKIAEAKARKKKRALKKLEKARKKAEGITDLSDVTAQEKVHQIKQVYKKAGVLGKRKREVEYVVAKKGVGKRVKRPAGVKGQFKVVDPRMKKDNRGKGAARTRKQRSGGKQKGRKR